MSIVLKLSICVSLLLIVANAKYIDNTASLSRDDVNVNMDRVKRAAIKRQTSSGSFESYESLDAQEDVVLRPLFVHRLLNRDRNGGQRRRLVNPIFSDVSNNKKLNFDDRPYNYF